MLRRVALVRTEDAILHSHRRENLKSYRKSLCVEVSLRDRKTSS
jgi:hypothetical protein